MPSAILGGTEQQKSDGLVLVDRYVRERIRLHARKTDNLRHCLRRGVLQGRTVAPGFNDAHDHFGIDLKGIQLQFNAFNPSWKETIEAVETAARQTPAHTWIFGTGGFDLLFSPEVSRFAVDRIVPNHPVVLRDFTWHCWIVNSKAMPLLQISEDAPIQLAVTTSALARAPGALTAGSGNMPAGTRHLRRPSS